MLLNAEAKWHVVEMAVYKFYKHVLVFQNPLNPLPSHEVHRLADTYHHISINLTIYIQFLLTTITML